MILPEPMVRTHSYPGFPPFGSVRRGARRDVPDSLSHQLLHLSHHSNEILERSIEERGSNKVEKKPPSATPHLRVGQEIGKQCLAGTDAEGEQCGEDEDGYDPIDVLRSVPHQAIQSPGPCAAGGAGTKRLAIISVQPGGIRCED